MTKRLFDLFFSFWGLLFLSPFFLLIGLLIKIDSKGSIFFIQKRVGRNNINFQLVKFRTMREDSERIRSLTIGEKDNRITKLGYYLRKYKLDELPQLYNVFIGDLSIVGPRPELSKYVDQYKIEYNAILTLRPGLTDISSIVFRNENRILSSIKEPEVFYIRNILPRKINYNIQYINNQSICLDIYIIFKTLWVIFKK